MLTFLLAAAAGAGFTTLALLLGHTLGKALLAMLEEEDALADRLERLVSLVERTNRPKH